MCRRQGLSSEQRVKVGDVPAARRADRELVEELRGFARGEASDRQPMPDLDSEALGFRAASESFGSIRRVGRRELCGELRVENAEKSLERPTS